MDKKISVKKDEYQIIDGRVVITSDELAQAISEQQFDLLGEDEADAAVIDINIGNRGGC